MNLFITCVNGMGGTALTAQRKVAKTAKEMGFDTMGYFRIEEKTDDDNELHHRIDGIISSLRPEDTVVVQFPTWNGLRYENFLFNHIKAYPGVKLILFVHDIDTLQIDPERSTLHHIIKLLNRADGLILPSDRMYRELKNAGLTVPESRIVYQTIWDYPTDLSFTDHRFEKRFLYTGEPSRFPFVEEYDGITPLHLFSREEPDRTTGQKVVWKGYLDEPELLMELARGGFGLVWCDETYYRQYYRMNQPYKLGVFLAAGIPVLIRKGSHQQEFIEKNHLGIAVESLEEADAVVQNMTEEEYRGFLTSVRRIQNLSLKGFYTRKALTDAVIAVGESDIDTKKVLGR